MLFPYVVSSEKKRNINNDLAILLSHDKKGGSMIIFREFQLAF